MPGQDVLVIGAGIIGCSVARELGQRGVERSHVRGADSWCGCHAGLGGDSRSIHRGPRPRTAVQYSGCGRFGCTARSYGRCRKNPGSPSNTGDAERSKLRPMRRPRRACRPPPRVSPILRWLDAAAARSQEGALAASIEGALLASGHGYVAVPVFDGCPGVGSAASWRPDRGRPPRHRHPRQPATAPRSARTTGPPGPLGPGGHSGRQLGRASGHGRRRGPACARFGVSSFGCTGAGRRSTTSSGVRTVMWSPGRT